MLVSGSVALLCIAAPFIAHQLVPDLVLLPVLPFSVLFIFLASSVSHYFVSNAISGRPQSFINVFMGSMGIKLALYFAFIIIYVFTHNSDAVSFLLWFMTYYVVFTGLDIGFLLSQNSKKN